MTFRLESERMFVGVLAAAVLHALLFVVVHKLLDQRLDTRPMTVSLIGPAARQAAGREPERAQPAPQSAPRRQEAQAPVTSKAAPQPVVERAAPAPAAAERPAPQPVVAARPAPAQDRVDPQPRTPAQAPAEPTSPVQRPLAAAARQAFDAAHVRGRAGLNAQASAAGEAVAVTTPIAAPAGAAGSQGALAPALSGEAARPADEPVYAKSASRPSPNARTAQAAGAGSAVPVVRDAGLAGPTRQAAAAAPVRTSGTPTARSGATAAAAAGSPAGASLPVSYSSPSVAKPAPVGATVYGGAPAPAADAPSAESRIDDLDRALDAGARAAAAAGGAGGQSEEAAGGPAGRDPRLPEGWNVSGSLGLRPLLNVIHPVLSDRYPDEIVQMTVRVLIRVDPAGWVRVERFDQDSGSTELNNEITKTLRQWRYEPVEDRDPAYGVVTIQIRSRSN